MDQQLSLNSSYHYKLRLGLAGIGLLCFAFIAWQMTSGGVKGFDSAICGFAYGTRGPVLNKVLISITYLGNWQLITVLAMVLLVLPRTRMSIGFPFMITSICSVIIYKPLKLIFQRPRPDVSLRIITEGGYSFPSGHALNGLVCYGMLIFLIRRNCSNRRTANILTVLLTLLILTIGWSRIFVGVHYPSDILGGWSFGLAVLMIATVIYDAIMKKQREKR